MNRRLGSVHVNEIQGNPFQPDVSFRGYTASPLLGTPQGLSVYVDGVRMNQPFGDIVSWDLLPRTAIASIALMPGSNPLFGLNTLGGALSVQTKDGFAHRAHRCSSPPAATAGCRPSSRAAATMRAGSRGTARPTCFAKAAGATTRRRASARRSASSAGAPGRRAPP
jgi:TonB-dependent Receptor Plug Domain.